MTSLLGHTNWVTSCSFSSDATKVATGSNDKSVKIWDITKGKEIVSFENIGSAKGILFNPKGTTVASGAHDGKLRIMDINSGRMVQY